MSKLRLGSVAGLAVSVPIIGVVHIILCVHALQAPALRHLVNSFEFSHIMYVICLCYRDAGLHTQAGLCRQSWSMCIRISIGIRKLAMCHGQGKPPVLHMHVVL